MKKIIFGIFAHPDDEAFGPCGTLISETSAGSELHLITLTPGDGDKSMNPDNVPNLGEVRTQEWQEAAKLLGADSTTMLGYSDGKLGNDDHIAIAARIESIIQEVVSKKEDYEIEVLCFDLNGLTGHIDHIVASRSACLAFYRLRAKGMPMQRIRLYCLSSKDYPAADTGFVFMQAGRTQHEIQETIDARPYLDQVHAVMRCHHTQRGDAESQIQKLGDDIAIDHFLILS